MIKNIIITLILVASSIIPAIAKKGDKVLDTTLVVKDNFWPTFKRVNRNVNKITFAYKGELIGGVTASYATMSSKNSEIFAIFNNINAQGSITSVKPFVGYFYSNNKCVGLRFGYSSINGGIDSALIDLGPSNDMTFEVPYAHVNSSGYSYSIFHRNYAGLDARGRVGLFAEIELEGSSANNIYEFAMGDTKITSRNRSRHYGLNFNPGVAVYILPNVCTSLSFGLGGINYNLIENLDEHSNVVGTRNDSKLSLRLNLTAINIGMTIHLWDKGE